MFVSELCKWQNILIQLRLTLAKLCPVFLYISQEKNQSHKIATALQRNDRSGFSLAEWRRMGLLNVAAVKMLIYKIQDGGWSMRLSDPLCVIAPNFAEIGHTIAIKFLSRKKRNHVNCTQWRSHTNGVRGVRTTCKRKIHHFQAVWYVMTFFDCTADLLGQLNGNGQKGMLQIDAPRSKISVYATDCAWTWKTVSRDCQNESKFDRGLSRGAEKLNRPPNSCMPSSAKMTMNRNNRSRRLAIERTELSRDVTRLRSDDQ